MGRHAAQQAALAALTHASPAAATAFHTGHFPKGHGPTQAERWAAAAAPYEVGARRSGCRAIIEIRARRASL